ncbi:uncharacterized protein LOC127529346 isoform X3 [Erpetoichthys calabaricus]|uniref:uncharacterized protein LOC127529346 isoform X3 n=1 Tax=Erpetoichthys calabaricus TaxID=27687 RepID=UPI00223489E2|nr:uncharacterized protein LOC127529346 isoform X3 [Erpetoichthys calabaricus]
MEMLLKLTRGSTTSKEPSKCQRSLEHAELANATLETRRQKQEAECTQLRQTLQEIDEVLHQGVYEGHLPEFPSCSSISSSTVETSSVISEEYLNPKPFFHRLKKHLKYTVKKKRKSYQERLQNLELKRESLEMSLEKRELEIKELKNELEKKTQVLKRATLERKEQKTKSWVPVNNSDNWKIFEFWKMKTSETSQESEEVEMNVLCKRNINEAEDCCSGAMEWSEGREENYLNKGLRDTLKMNTGRKYIHGDSSKVEVCSAKNWETLEFWKLKTASRLDDFKKDGERQTCNSLRAPKKMNKQRNIPMDAAEMGTQSEKRFTDNDFTVSRKVLSMFDNSDLASGKESSQSARERECSSLSTTQSVNLREVSLLWPSEDTMEEKRNVSDSSVLSINGKNSPSEINEIINRAESIHLNTSEVGSIEDYNRSDSFDLDKLGEEEYYQHVDATSIINTKEFTSLDPYLVATKKERKTWTSDIKSVTDIKIVKMANKGNCTPPDTPKQNNRIELASLKTLDVHPIDSGDIVAAGEGNSKDTTKKISSVKITSFANSASDNSEEAFRGESCGTQDTAIADRRKQITAFDVPELVNGDHPTILNTSEEHREECSFTDTATPLDDSEVVRYGETGQHNSNNLVRKLEFSPSECSGVAYKEEHESFSTAEMETFGESHLLNSRDIINTDELSFLDDSAIVRNGSTLDTSEMFNSPENCSKIIHDTHVSILDAPEEISEEQCSLYYSSVKTREEEKEEDSPQDSPKMINKKDIRKEYNVLDTTVLIDAKQKVVDNNLLHSSLDTFDVVHAKDSTVQISMMVNEEHRSLHNIKGVNGEESNHLVTKLTHEGEKSNWQIVLDMANGGERRFVNISKVNERDCCSLMGSVNIANEGNDSSLDAGNDCSPSSTAKITAGSECNALFNSSTILENECNHFETVTDNSGEKECSLGSEGECHLLENLEISEAPCTSFETSELFGSLDLVLGSRAKSCLLDNSEAISENKCTSLSTEKETSISSWLSTGTHDCNAQNISEATIKEKCWSRESTFLPADDCCLFHMHSLVNGVDCIHLSKNNAGDEEHTNRNTFKVGMKDQSSKTDTSEVATGGKICPLNISRMIEADKCLLLINPKMTVSNKSNILSTFNIVSDFDCKHIHTPEVISGQKCHPLCNFNVVIENKSNHLYTCNQFAIGQCSLENEGMCEHADQQKLVSRDECDCSGCPKIINSVDTSNVLKGSETNPLDMSKMECGSKSRQFDVINGDEHSISSTSEICIKNKSTSLYNSKVRSSDSSCSSDVITIGELHCMSPSDMILIEDSSPSNVSDTASVIDCSPTEVPDMITEEYSNCDTSEVSVREDVHLNSSDVVSKWQWWSLYTPDMVNRGNNNSSCTSKIPRLSSSNMSYKEMSKSASSKEESPPEVVNEVEIIPLDSPEVANEVEVIPLDSPEVVNEVEVIPQESTELTHRTEYISSESDDVEIIEDSPSNDNMVDPIEISSSESGGIDLIEINSSDSEIAEVIECSSSESEVIEITKGRPFDNKMVTFSPAREMEKTIKVNTSVCTERGHKGDEHGEETFFTASPELKQSLLFWSEQ